MAEPDDPGSGPFRSDHEAALARADALEREADELRRQNQALRRDGQAARAEAAEARRALEALATRDPGVVEPRERARAPSRAVRLQDEALAVTTPVGLIQAGLIVAPTAVSLMLFAGRIGVLAALPGLVAGVLAAGLVAGGLLGGRAARERRWLDELPLPIERTAYLTLLGTAHGEETVLVVRVELAAEPDDDTRALLERAVRGAMRGGTAAFTGSALLIHSPPLQTRFAVGRTTSATRPYNGEIHQWMRRLIRRALLPIAQVQPVARIQVRVAGKV